MIKYILPLLLLPTLANAEYLRTDAGELPYRASVAVAVKPIIRIAPKTVSIPKPRPVINTASQPAISGDCRITGDSIAYQIAATRIIPCAVVLCAVGVDGPNCSAKGAMNSSWVLRHTKPSRVAIFSVSSNDIKDWHPTIIINGKKVANPNRQLLANKAKTMVNLESIRKASNCVVCIWIKPILREPSEAVVNIAAKYGDTLIAFKNSNDGVHPANPKAVAIEIIKGGEIFTNHR